MKHNTIYCGIIPCSTMLLVVCICSALAIARTKGHMEPEPQCLSRFDYDYKMMTKLVAMETELKQLTESIKDLQKLRDSKVQSTGTGSTFVRWGRTTCPGNGSTKVYKGYSAGSYYSHKGAAAEYLCLPEEPTWLHFAAGNQNSGGKLYAGEYQYDGQRRIDFFGKEVYDHNAPCVVCHTPRPTVLMIPGRNKCYDGWTMEYHGYLTSGHHSHEAATQYICADVNLETVSNSETDSNGKLFYFVETVCGSLPCPPYHDNRELSCVVCSM